MNKTWLGTYTLIAFSFILGTSNPSYTQDIQKIDIDYVINNYPERTKRLFDSLNLEIKGLEKTKKYVEKKKYKKACLSLLEYYKQSNRDELFEMADRKNETNIVKRANQILKDTFTFQNFTARQKRCNNGLID